MFAANDRLIRFHALPISGTNAERKRITAICFSENHAVALLSSGEALAIGDNANGKLGTGSANKAIIFTLVQTRESIVDIVVGSWLRL
jgi:alpha-tubulin suppressor-like RCC1 family protein